MRPGEFQRVAYDALHAAGRGRIYVPEECAGCGCSGYLRLWIADPERDARGSVIRLCPWCMSRWKSEPSFKQQIREMIREMATFHNWLMDQLVRPENDPVGWLARQWKSHEGNRPKASSPTGIGRFLADQAGEDTHARSYVTEAVKAATTAYRERDAGPITTRDGEPANAAAETALNPATGKPAAVVPSSAWVSHPDASQFGTCAREGWARGLANLAGDVPDGVPRAVITCAAGHIFEPEKPGPTSGSVPVSPGDSPTAVPNGPGDVQGALSGPAGQQELPLPLPLDAPTAEALTSVGITAAEAKEVFTAELIADGAAVLQSEVLEQIVLTQGMILHTLTRIARHIGLPPEQLDEFVDGSVSFTAPIGQNAAIAFGQLPAALSAPVPSWTPPASAVPPAGAPGDLSSQLYGLAGNPAPGHQPGNDPQAYAGWFNAAEYGDPGNG